MSPPHSPVSGPQGTPSPLRGIAWMLLAMVFISAQDALAKYLSQIYPLAVVVWGRYAFHFLIMAAVLAPRMPFLLKTQRPWMQALRAGLLYSITVLFIGAILYIPIADGAAIMFLAPILVTALSVPLLGEQVGLRRWAGVAIGLVGALIVVRPGLGVMHWATLMALAATFSFALFQITTRILSRTDHPLTTLFYSSVGCLLLSSVVVPFYWQNPSLEHWGWLVVLGSIGAASHFALIKAFQHAEAAVVSPLSYTSLLWSTGFGYVIFNEMPDRWTFIGAAIIAASGLYILVRERQLRK